MNIIYTMEDLRSINPWMMDAWGYLVDRSQRTVLFWDVLRKRGNAYRANVEAGQPGSMVFDYEMVLDGRIFDQPVNYSLVRVLNRRLSERGKGPRHKSDRRLTHEGHDVDSAGRPCRPIVVIDPRSGFGPGIGGSSFSSQIGLALDYGHPVYNIQFYTNPERGQTIARVQQALIRFLESVAQRHPYAPKPAVIGNCQAGWAAALICADRPDVSGPMVLNGSPLSYWGGVEGTTPMRYKGGLLGGVWLTSLLCDLGAGLFDGANIVAGFEDLNPAYTYWTKLYNLFSKIDSEEQRFLNSERRSGSFFKLTAKEIHLIVDRLFIGNELEQGHLTLEDGRGIDLKNIEEPILAFASAGDDITSPPQAFNWIKKVYGSVDEIKRCGQVIIYLVHDHIGHLGIFVSGEVARKEHNQILGNLGWLDYLIPGLYEMVIEGGPGSDDYQVRFEARQIEDLLRMDDGFNGESQFLQVHALSRFYDNLYRRIASPWVQMAISPSTARFIRGLHPLRVQRYMISDANPLLWPVQWTAGPIKSRRHQVGDNNLWVALETFFSESIKIGFDLYRDMRDLYQYGCFKALYDNPWMEMMFGKGDRAMVGAESSPKADSKQISQEKRRLDQQFTKGGFVEACVRIMIAVAGAGRVVDTLTLRAAEELIQDHHQLRIIKPQLYKTIIKIQSRLLESDFQKALDGLAEMLLTERERQTAIEIGRRIAKADGQIDRREKAVLVAIGDALEAKA